MFKRPSTWGEGEEDRMSAETEWPDLGDSEHIDCQHTTVNNKYDFSHNKNSSKKTT